MSLFSLSIGLRSLVKETPQTLRLHFTKSYIFETSAVGNWLFVIAKIPIRSFGYAIGLRSARVPPSYSSSPNILNIRSKTPWAKSHENGEVHQ
jgi:hypothetical protein